MNGLFAGRRQSLLILLVLLSLILAVFWPALNNDFVRYDDNMNVTGNPHVQEGLSWEAVKWAFTTDYGANWHPLTWLSHMLDWQMFGLNPRGHHLTSVLWHMADTALLFLALSQLTGAPAQSAIVAALFAIHPLHVESVAWVAERKDVLSAFFGMLTLLAYARYARRPRRVAFLPVAGVFALGLMAKPMLVSLPLVLLLLDYWPLSRLRPQVYKGKQAPARATDPPYRDRKGAAVECRASDRPYRDPFWELVTEKWPLLAIALASSIITMAAQRSWGAVQSLEDLSVYARVGNALVSYIRYIEKMLWPVNLAAFYPHPGRNLPVWQPALALLLLVGITIMAVRLGDRHPYLPVGWFWYLGTLVPVIGIVQVGGQAMADRYSYIPLIGLFIVIAWGVPDLLAGLPRRRLILGGAAMAAIALLAGLARVQVGTWRDTVTLFEHAIRVVPRNYLAHNNLGYLFAEQGRLDEAIVQYNEALKIRPWYVHAHNNLGAALAAKGRVQEAMEHYAAALQIRPVQSEAHVNVGIEMAARGKADEALFHFTQALRADPDDPKAHYNLGLVLAAQGKIDEAVMHYRKALQNRHDYPQAHVNLGVALAQQGKPADALAQYQEALRLRPDYPEAHINMGIELAGQGNLNEALGHFKEAARLNPRSAEAHFNLGKAYLLLGNHAAALEEEKALAALNPGMAAELNKLVGQ